MQLPRIATSTWPPSAPIAPRAIGATPIGGRHAGHVVELGLFVVGVGMIVWGAEQFAEHLAAASARLGVSTFALAVLLGFLGLVLTSRPLVAGAAICVALSLGTFVLLPMTEMARNRRR